MDNHDCNNCRYCDSSSKNNYQFKDDASFSEHFEQEIIAKIPDSKKSTGPGYPDIDCGQFFIEVKVQRRTFMSIKKFLPDADLGPYETVALNLSDLKRYFEIYEQNKVPIYILWVLLDRPCITIEPKYFYQDIIVLRNIYNIYQDKRKFTRKSGKGDVVDGIHKGVVVNYHFSINELIEGIPI